MDTMPSQFALKGTTTVGVVCTDGVILSADTRATMGFFIAHKKARKIYRIADHLAATISGTVADGQRSVEMIRIHSRLYELSTNRKMSVKAASRFISNWLFSQRFAPLITFSLIGGFDSTGPHVISLDLFGSITEEKCTATGSGSPIALGVLEDRYDEALAIEDLLPIVAHAVSSAMKRDTASGDSFDVVTIDKEGYKELDAKQKSQLLSIKL